jgi:hypothetical protein
MPAKLLRRFLGVLAVFLPGGAIAADDVDFARDVRPILSRHCFKCHGPDDGQRQAGLRLDVREAALEKADSGERAIVPGKIGESELMNRIMSDDENTVMPPPETKQSLTDAQKDVLKKWIAAGAEYKPHWAFIAPERPALPAVAQRDWPARGRAGWITSCWRGWRTRS